MSDVLRPDPAAPSGAGARPLDPSAMPSPGASPSGPPGRAASLLPTPGDPLFEPYRDENHPRHRDAVAAVHARFQAAHPAGDSATAEMLLDKPYTLAPVGPPEIYDPGVMTEAAAVFRDVGVEQAPAQAAMDWVGGLRANLPAAQLALGVRAPDGAATAAVLRREWGGDYAAKLADAQDAVALVAAQRAGSIGGEQADAALDAVEAWLAQSGTGNHPRAIKFFADLAARVDPGLRRQLRAWRQSR